MENKTEWGDTAQGCICQKKGRDTIFWLEPEISLFKTLALHNSFVYCFGFPKSKYHKEFLTPNKKVFANWSKCPTPFIIHLGYICQLLVFIAKNVIFSPSSDLSLTVYFSPFYNT